MSSLDNARSEIYDMLMEYIASNDNVAFCDNCPELRYIEDCGCFDCPYGLDAMSCEFSPASQLEDDVDKIMRTIDACKP